MTEFCKLLLREQLRQRLKKLMDRLRVNNAEDLEPNCRPFSTAFKKLVRIFAYIRIVFNILARLFTSQDFIKKSSE
jgi:hypothetical protein